MEQVKTRDQLVKSLIAVGFAWDFRQEAWIRARDDGAIADEALRSVCELWPATIPAIARAFTESSEVANFDLAIGTREGSVYSQQYTLSFRDAQGRVL